MDRGEDPHCGGQDRFGQGSRRRLRRLRNARQAAEGTEHQGSANLIDEAIHHRDVDYFLAGISGRGFTPHYTARILRLLSPRVVVPHHHDDFFRPLDEPMGFSFNVNFGGFVEEVAAVSREFQVRCLELLQTVPG
jgi:L-ascorbate metabolism protein UlaG (beta-lactamase superfamily)